MSECPKKIKSQIRKHTPKKKKKKKKKKIK